MLVTRPREGFSEAYLAGWDLAEALAKRGEAGKVVALHRMPDGKFAPKGLGMVLKQQMKVSLPGGAQGTVVGTTPGTAHVQLDDGSNLAVHSKPQGQASPGMSGPIPNYDHVPLVAEGKAAGGSTGAQIRQTATGEKHLVKAYGGDQDRVATELAANAIYRTMGAKAPAMGTRTENGKQAISYPLLEGKPTKITKPSSKIGKHYMTDAFLANWDFIGLTDDNILWGPDGDPFRVDHGGTMTKRAQGKDKPFGPTVGEVESMLKPGQGQGHGKIIVTEKGLKQQAADIASTLTDAKIDEIMQAAPYASEALRDSHTHALKARRDWMKGFAEGKYPLSEETKAQLYVHVADEKKAQGGGVAAKYGGAVPKASEPAPKSAAEPAPKSAAKPEVGKAEPSKKLKTAWAAFDKKMAEFKEAKGSLIAGANDSDKKEVAKIASQVRAAKWAIKRAGGDPNDRPEWAKPQVESYDPKTGPSAEQKAANAEKMGAKPSAPKPALKSSAGLGAAIKNVDLGKLDDADPEWLKAALALASTKDLAKLYLEAEDANYHTMNKSVEAELTKRGFTYSQYSAAAAGGKASAEPAATPGPDGASLYNKFQSTPYGDSGIVTKDVSKAQADAMAAYLNEKQDGSYAVEASSSPGKWFVKGKLGSNKPKATDAPKVGKKPYPGLKGSHVVVQHNGGGEWTAVQGANSEAAAKKHAAKYPGQTKVIPNGPGDQPHPGSHYGNGKYAPKDEAKDAAKPAAPKPGDMPDLEAQLKASVAAAQAKKASAPKSPLAAAAAKPDAPASMPSAPAPKPAAETTAAPSVPSPASGPSAGAGSAVPSSYDAEYQPNTQGLDLAHMKQGDMFTMNDGSQWTYHKPTAGGDFHIVKPVGGGKAKPFHGKMQPPFVAPGGGDGAPAPTAAAPKAAEPSNDDLFAKLSSSVEQAKAGVKSKDMVDPNAAPAPAPAPAAAAPAPAAPSAPQNPLQAALDAYKAAGGDDPAILASLGDTPAAAPDFVAPAGDTVAATPAAKNPDGSQTPAMNAAGQYLGAEQITPPAPAPAPATTVGDYLHNPALAASPGRGPTGKLRNFQAMSLGKLHGAIADLENYGKDPAALEAAKMALAAKAA